MGPPGTWPGTSNRRAMIIQPSIDAAHAVGRTLEPAATRRGMLAVGLLLAASLAGCGGAAPGTGSTEAGTDSALIEATRATAAPQLDQLEGLDQRAADAIRNAADELASSIDRSSAWTGLGILLHAHRRFEAARSCYEQGLLRDPHDARTWYFRALIDDQLGATDRAERGLERCLEIEASYPPAHWRLGLLQLGRGDLERAEESMLAALAISPHDAASVVGLARVRMQQGDGAAAVDLLEAHTERIPGDDNARFLLGTAYRQVGRMQDAARVLATGAGADPIRNDPWQAVIIGHRRGYRADFLEATEVLARGEVKRAIALLERLREQQPDDTLVQLSLHRALRADGALDESIGLLLETREREPLHEMVHLHLAGAYLEQAKLGGDPADQVLLLAALQCSQRARELAPSYPSAHGMHGDILTALDQTDAATDAYLLAAELGRDSIQWHRLSARSLCAAGRWQEALRVLDRLDVLEPDSARTLYFIGVAHGSTGQLERARVALARAVELAPDDQGIDAAYERVLSALDIEKQHE
ncbi:MAG: tetratricopeptide (TPR) repeat protein [Chlamydiales bacterium]|jgi:tetratricopeptide (TPR) repeat protein